MDHLRGVTKMIKNIPTTRIVFELICDFCLRFSPCLLLALMSYFLFLDDQRDPKDAFCHDENAMLADLSGIPNGSWLVVRSYDEFKRAIDERGIPLAVSFDCDLAEEHVSHYMRNHGTGIYEWENFHTKCGVHCARYLKNALHSKEIRVFVHSANSIGRVIIKGIFSIL